MITIFFVPMQPVLFSHLVLSVGLGKKDSEHIEDLTNLLSHADGALSSNKFFSGVEYTAENFYYIYKILQTSLYGYNSACALIGC